MYLATLPPGLLTTTEKPEGFQGKDVSCKRGTTGDQQCQKQEAEICARGTEGDRSNLSECVGLLGVTTPTTLKFKRPMTASGVLSTSLFASLAFFPSVFPTNSFKSQKVGQVRKLAWSNLGVVLCLAVKSNARNCELSWLRLFFLLLKFRDVQLTPSTLQNRAGKWIKGGEVVWCKNIIWLDTLQLMLNLLLHSVNKCGRGGCYRREWLWEHMSHFPVTLSHADDFL